MAGIKKLKANYKAYESKPDNKQKTRRFVLGEN